MSSFGTRSHSSHRGPRPPRRPAGPLAIAGTAVVAVLAVVVVVLAYRVGNGNSGPTIGDFSELEARVVALSGQVNGMQATVQEAARQAKLAAAAAKKQSTAKPQAEPALAPCLVQIQREIDDLQAYLAYRTPPRRDRVGGACLPLLQPRFKG